MLASFCLIALCAPAFAQVDWDGGRDPVEQMRDVRSLGSLPAPPVPAAREEPSLGLVVNASEVGLVKFHRHDNGVHPYGAGSAWAAYTNLQGDVTRTPLVSALPGGGVTIVFSSLEELLRTIVSISRDRRAKVSVLNIHAHGLPGGTWFPKDAAQKQSGECRPWNTLAAKPDKASYDMYYSAVSKQQILGLRQLAQGHGHLPCVVGAPEWREIVGRVPEIRSVFSGDAVVHFHSCLVGLGRAGEEFAAAVAGLLLSGGTASVHTSINFGLGDWSMPEGMGFWDYLNDEQLRRDGQIYPVNRTDREIMQAGAIRQARYADGGWTTTTVEGQYFMSAGKTPVSVSVAQVPPARRPVVFRPAVTPGPNVYTYILGY